MAPANNFQKTLVTPTNYISSEREFIGESFIRVIRRIHVPSTSRTPPLDKMFHKMPKWPVEKFVVFAVVVFV